MEARSLPVLLQLIDAEATDPFMSNRIVEAHQAGIITTAEARHLQSFERRTPKSRQRALADAVDVTPEAVSRMRAKLEAVHAEFIQRYPHLKDRDVR